MDHLEILSKLFDGYFGGGELEISQKWIINPYFFNLDYMTNDEKLKDDLIELRTNHVSKMQFQSKNLEQHWSLAMDMFPKLCEKALSVLIPFSTTYLCQSGFNALLSIKTKYRNHLSAQIDMRVAISNKVPRFEKLLSNKQKQKSYYI